MIRGGDKKQDLLVVLKQSVKASAHVEGTDDLEGTDDMEGTDDGTARPLWLPSLPQTLIFCNSVVPNSHSLLAGAGGHK